jgi:hypothetical protein
MLHLSRHHSGNPRALTSSNSIRSVAVSHWPQLVAFMGIWRRIRDIVQARI